jgi:hypothetical protein
VRKTRIVGSMKGMKSFGKYGALGFELVLSIAVGFLLGDYLDKRFGTHWIAFVGFLVGCYAGFRALYRAAKQMQRDVEIDERLARGEDPWAPPDDDDDDDDDALAEPAGGAAAPAAKEGIDADASKG